MYEKNLTEDLRLRLSAQDMDFLRKTADERSVSISECIRSIIGEYRRSLETVSMMNDLLKLAKETKEKEAGLSYGDTKTDFDNIV